jgi:hypothetical protein
MKVMCLLTLFPVLAACGPSTIDGLTTSTATQVPAQTAAPLSQEPPLVFFSSEPGKFQVWLPVSESVQDYTEKKTLFGELIECPLINFRLNGAYAFVQYCDLTPESVASLSNDEILDQAQGEIIRGIDATLDMPHRAVMQGTYPELALSGQADMRGMGDDGTFKARIILADTRIYLVAMSVYVEDWCNCLHQIDQVVDSLYIEPGLSIPFEPTP